MILYIYNKRGQPMEKILIFNTPESFDDYTIVEDRRIFTKDLNGVGTIILSGYGIFEIKDNIYPKFFKCDNFEDQYSLPQWHELSSELAYFYFTREQKILYEKLDEILIGISAAKRRIEKENN